jgi:hypothetical protein
VSPQQRRKSSATDLSPRTRAIVLAFAALLALAGCQSALDDCQKAHPSDPAAAQACFHAVLQQQNARLDRLHAAEYRGRD